MSDKPSPSTSCRTFMCRPKCSCRPCRTCSATTRRSWSSSMAATPWATGRRPRISPRTWFCSSNRASSPSSCTAAGRRSARCSKSSASSPSSRRGLRVTDAGHRRGRRDGAGRLDQQADRRLDRRRGRQGHRPLRQGRQHGDRPQGDPHRRRPGFQHREGGRSRLRRRARDGQPRRARPGARAPS